MIVRLELRILAFILLAASVPNGAAAGELDFAKDCDCTKMLLSLSAVPPPKNAPMRLDDEGVQALLAAYRAGYGRAFCGGMSIVTTEKQGKAFFKQADDGKYGFAAAVVVSDISRGMLLYTWKTAHKLHVRSGSGWRLLLAGTPKPDVRCYMSYGKPRFVSLVENPLELPFFETLLPMKVTGIEGDGADRVLKVRVQNLLPLRITGFGARVYPPNDWSLARETVAAEMVDKTPIPAKSERDVTMKCAGMPTDRAVSSVARIIAANVNVEAVKAAAKPAETGGK